MDLTAVTTAACAMGALEAKGADQDILDDTISLHEFVTEAFEDGEIPANAVEDVEGLCLNVMEALRQHGCEAIAGRIDKDILAGQLEKIEEVG